MLRRCNNIIQGRTRAYPLKVVDDIRGVAASEVGHGNADLLVVVVEVDADVLLQFLAAPQRCVNGILVNDPAVEQAVFWNLLEGGSGGSGKTFPVSMCQLRQPLSLCRLERSWTNLRYVVVTVDVDRGCHQHRRQDHQTEGEAAQARWERLLRTGRNHQLLLEGQRALFRGHVQDGCDLLWILNACPRSRRCLPSG